jgi:hypothetical protein
LIRVIRETHCTPASVQQRVARAGGLNRFGEPNFRVVWGGARLAWIGGRWTDRDAHGNVIRETIALRREPKYVPHDRWHIERWLPPEAYGSPETWRAQTTEVEDGIAIPALGPYPSRGDYEHCFTLAGPRGEFIPLSPAACDWIIRAVEWARRQPRTARLAAITARESRRALDFDHLADDIFDDAVPAFHAQPFVSIAGAASTPLSF